MSLDLTSFQPALKQLYPERKVENLAYKDHPLFALVAKDKNFGGQDAKIALKYAGAASSSTFSYAQANQTNALLKAFTITRAREYAVTSISNETIEASRNDAHALIRATTLAMDSCFEAASRNISISMYGTGSGSRGQVLSSSTSTSFTLKNIEDVVKFEVGYVLVFSTADGGGSVKSGTATIAGVNRDSGVITLSAALTSIDGTSGVAANDYVFVQGDYDAKFSGLSAWIPASTPSSSAFFGVDRTVDPTRLAGVRFDGSALPIEEALISAASRVAREGGAPDYCFMNYANFANLEKALSAKLTYVDVKANAEIGFRGIVINGPRGKITVLPDQDCPDTNAFLLTMDTWKLYSLGQAPRILDMDGLKMLRQSTADGVEIRVGAYLQLACNAPAYNCNLKLK